MQAFFLEKSMNNSLPIILSFKKNIFSDNNFLNLKEYFTILIKERMSSLKNTIYCPLLNECLNTSDILKMFDFYHSKDKKTIKIIYSKKKIKNIGAEEIIKSIDYGTINFKPKRIFYPLFDVFCKNYLMYL